MEKELISHANLASFEAAKRNFKKLDPQQVCEKSGAVLKNGHYILSYLGQQVSIHTQTCEALWEHPQRVRFIDTLVVLHYLVSADGSLPGEDRIALHDLAPAASGWSANILRNCIPPLAATFGADLPALFESAQLLGGKKISADSVEFFVLPHLPIYITIWEADEEFPADARILFDASMPRQLPGEDRLVVPELASYELMRISGKSFHMPSAGEFRNA